MKNVAKSNAFGTNSLSATGYAARSSTSLLEPFSFERRIPGPHDVLIDILYCGVCHTDIHFARNEWKDTIYPCMPGHEIVGRVAKAGRHVTRFKVGDRVGVGCMVDSCQNCVSCAEGLEQYCENGMTVTYNGQDRETGAITMGGYSDRIVVKESFVLHIPEALDLQAAAPLLCAGITTYSPLRHWKIGTGHKVGIVGIGGLGHMAIKIAKTLGAEATMITNTAGKGEDAHNLGAEGVLLSTDEQAMKNSASKFDFILDTIPIGHNINPYMELLKRDGTMVILGALEPLQAVNTGPMAYKRQSIGTSLIGGIEETQEVLDFCATHKIQPDIEVIPIQKINEAYERVIRSDVRYRFVIDMASLKS